MASKMVTDREKVDEALVAALATHREKVLEGLHERLAPWLPDGVDGSGFAPYYDALTGWIRSEQDTLAEMDRRTLAERLEDRLPRRQRDEVAEDLRQRLMAFRRAAIAMFGPDSGKEFLQFDGFLSRDPKVIHRTAANVLESLRNPNLEQPTPQISGIQIDSAEWLERLEPLTQELEELLRDVAQDRETTNTMLVEKGTTMEEHDHNVRLATRYVVSLLQLAGESKLADLVRRAVRRRASRSDVQALEDASQTPPGSASGSDGGASTAGSGASGTTQEAPAAANSPAAADRAA